MANLEKIIAQKAENDAQWREERQSERETAAAMQEAGLEEITSNPEAYARYLELQGDNPSYSAGNIALVMFSMEGATVFGTEERWKKEGRTILASETGKGVKIFARSPMGKSYLAEAYDVKQTQGRAVRDIQLRSDSKEMDAALTTLLNYSPVPVETNGELDCAALYDPERMVLVINPACSDNEAFAAIASEVAQARFHSKGTNHFYDHEDSRLDAESVSYILCRRFGVECELPDASRVAELYDGWSTEQRSGAMNSIQDMSKQISGSIKRDITPQQRGRFPENRPQR